MNPGPRVLAATGIHNFRDYGGYAVAGTRHLARGRLYRSGELAQPTAADLALVDSLGLAAVIDLRGAAERQMSPCRFPAGFSAPVLYADGETAHSHAAPHVEAMAGALNGEQARARMLNGYTTMPFRPLLVEVLRLYFRSLAESDGPTLVYCTAGKDRTGFAVALLHSALGVHRDDILEDYLLTNTAGDARARTAAIRDDMDRRFKASMSEEAVRVVTSVEPQWLERSFDVIGERYASIDSYLADVLRVTASMRKQLENRLLV